MNIAILGSTSQIAKDLIYSFSTEDDKKFHLFSRRQDDVAKWLKSVGLSERHQIDDYVAFGTQEFDAILNFVGIGNPAKASAMGASIFDVTLEYDELALNYLRRHPSCRYIFLSSGAAYGSRFDVPASEETKSIIDINKLQPQDWYGVAKLNAECRHRSLEHLPIVDIRVFNYFSHSQDLNSRYLITDIFRSIRDKKTLKTSSELMVRDYITPTDFYGIINAIFNSPAKNDVIDCYTKSPIDKLILLDSIKENFGLKYEFQENAEVVNATGQKPHYYSLNKRASQFGYQPSFTSPDGIIHEAKLLFLT